MDKRCGNCRFKGKEIGGMVWADEEWKDGPTGFFACLQIEHDKAWRYQKGSGAIVVDGSGYYAALCVEEDFACVKWEPLT